MEFFRLLHKAQRLAVSVRRRHGKVPVQIFLRRLSLCLGNDSHRHSVEPRDPADDRMIILKIAVSVKLHKICKQCIDIIRSYRTVLLS